MSDAEGGTLLYPRGWTVNSTANIFLGSCTQPLSLRVLEYLSIGGIRADLCFRNRRNLTYLLIACTLMKTMDVSNVQNVLLNSTEITTWFRLESHAVLQF